MLFYSLSCATAARNVLSTSSFVNDSQQIGQVLILLVHSRHIVKCPHDFRRTSGSLPKHTEQSHREEDDDEEEDDDDDDDGGGGAGTTAFAWPHFRHFFLDAKFCS
jgi:hypothetical protein